MPCFLFKAKKKKFHVFLFDTHKRPRKQSQPKQTKQIIDKPKCTHQAMIATHSLSKPLNVFTPQAYKPTILNLQPNNVTILSSSISGGNWQMLRQEMRLRDHLQPTETMGLSGPDPEVVAKKRPITRMCMCQNKRVPSGRSLKLESLRGGTAPSDVSSVAERARLTPHLLDDAEREFKEILSDDLVDFERLKVPIPISCI